jgi:cyclophilin family peptidyl-prolyl cis-trans isomerase
MKGESGTVPEATLSAVRHLLVIALIGLVAPLAGCGSDKSKSDSSTAAPTGSPASTPPGPTGPTASASADGCTQADAPKVGKRKAEKPKGKLAKGRKYALVFATNCGDFTVTLDPKLAPEASASMVSLAKQKFFDATAFHRIAPGFVIQGGDPTAGGTGGPGYTTHDKPPADATYPKGTFAMAKGGSEPPGTGGSQFFVMTGDRGLPPEYAIVGKVTAGMDVVDRIGALGDAYEQPTQVVVIEKVTVKES